MSNTESSNQTMAPVAPAAETENINVGEEFSPHQQKPQGDGGLTVKSISIECVIPCKHQLRGDYTEDNDSLQQSMRTHGMYEPITVSESKEQPGFYYVPDGWRRVCAAKLLGWKTLSAILLPAKNYGELLEIAITKNIERKTIDAMDLARSIDILKKTYGYTGEEVAIKTGISPERQSQLLKLLTLDPSVQEKIRSKKLTAAHGSAIAGLSNPEEQKNLANRALKRKYSVRQLGEKVRKYKLKESQASNSESQVSNVAAKQGMAKAPDVFFKSSEDMSEIQDGKVHLIMSSPPYGLEMEFEKGYTPETIFEENKKVLDECVRKLCPGGFLALNLADITYFFRRTGNAKVREWFYAGVNYQEYLRPLGVRLRDVVQWWKKNLNWANCNHMFPIERVPHTAYRFSNQTEQILIFQKEGVRKELPPEEVQTTSHLTDQQFREYGRNVWEINIVRANHDHPCVYPEELCERVIKMFSFEGDTVLDPWLGSGTTLKVARELNRVGIGYERELRYKPVIMKKLGLQPAEQQNAPAAGSMMAHAEKMLKGTCSDTSTESSADGLVRANDGFAQETPMEHPLCGSVQSSDDFIAAGSLFYSAPAATVSASPAA